MVNEVSRAELVAIIRDIVNNGDSGSVLLKDEKQHSAIIAVEEGKIISISYGVKRGMRALPYLQAIKTCTYRVNGMILGRPIPDLLSTDKLLDAFQNGDGAKTVLYEVNSDKSFNTKQALEVLKNHLTDIIGPVAQMILDDGLEEIGEIKTLAKFKMLLKHIAKEDLDKDEAFTFVADVLHKL